MATTIEVKRTTWKRLNGLKEPGQSFDDVVNDLIDDSVEAVGRNQ